MAGKLNSLLYGGDSAYSIASDIGLTVFRVFIGLSMAVAHGLGKVPPSEGFVNKVSSLGFPNPALFAWGAGLSELVCGFMLAIGLVTRISAFFLAITMGVAAFMAHGGDIFGGNFAGGEKALLFFFGYLVFFFSGSGRFSVDSKLRG